MSTEPYEPIKQQLLAHLETADPNGGLSEAGFATLGALVEQMRPVSPVPEPLNAMQHVVGRWETMFAHFGVRHSAMKTLVHDSNLKQQSFNRFPEVPIRVLRICQEIETTGQAYNNVIDFKTADGGSDGVIVIRGRYRAEDGTPQRFFVEFYRAEISPGAGTTEAQLRASLGFTNDEALTAEIKPPRLHSDVVYLDHDMRINIGSLGGLYVLKKSAEPAFSVQIG